MGQGTLYVRFRGSIYQLRVVVINFRYHIVSLMAVFIALSVGIAVGVSLGPSVDQGLLQQAAQDRKQVTDLRAELDRRNVLDDYHEAFDAAGRRGDDRRRDPRSYRVALVSMPDAPDAVVQAISTAVDTAGGTLVREVEITPDAFDPAKAADIDDALAPYGDLDLNDSMSQADHGRGRSRPAIASPQVEDRDQLAVAVGEALTEQGLARSAGAPTAQAPAGDRGRRGRRPTRRPTASSWLRTCDFDLALEGARRGGAGRPEQCRARRHRRARGAVGPGR